MRYALYLDGVVVESIRESCSKTGNHAALWRIDEQVNQQNGAYMQGQRRLLEQQAQQSKPAETTATKKASSPKAKK